MSRRAFHSSTTSVPFFHSFQMALDASSSKTMEVITSAPSVHLELVRYGKVFVVRGTADRPAETSKHAKMLKLLDGKYNGSLKDPSRPGGVFAGWMFFDKHKDNVSNWMSKLAPVATAPAAAPVATVVSGSTIPTADVPALASPPSLSIEWSSSSSPLELIKYGKVHVVRGVASDPGATKGHTAALKELRGKYNGMLKDPTRPGGTFAGWMFFDDAKESVTKWLMAMTRGASSAVAVASSSTPHDGVVPSTSSGPPGDLATPLAVAPSAPPTTAVAKAEDEPTVAAASKPIELVLTAPHCPLELIKYGKVYVVRGTSAHPQATTKYTSELKRLQGKYNASLKDASRPGGTFAGWMFFDKHKAAVADWLTGGKGSSSSPAAATTTGATTDVTVVSPAKRSRESPPHAAGGAAADDDGGDD